MIVSPGRFVIWPCSGSDPGGGPIDVHPLSHRQPRPCAGLHGKDGSTRRRRYLSNRTSAMIRIEEKVTFAVDVTDRDAAGRERPIRAVRGNPKRAALREGPRLESTWHTSMAPERTSLAPEVYRSGGKTVTGAGW